MDDPSALECELAETLHGLLSIFISSFKEREFSALRFNPDTHPRDMWDLWTIAERSRDTTWWNLQNIITTKRIFFACFPTLAQQIDEDASPREAFRQFATIAARDRPADRVPFYTEQARLWKKNTPQYWELALSDFAQNKGARYGMIRCTSNQYNAMQLATVLESFRQGRLYVRVKWAGKKESTQVLALGLHDSFNNSELINLAIRFMWPNPSKEDETDVIYLTMRADHRGYYQKSLGHPTESRSVRLITGTEHFNHAAYITNYRLPRWIFRKHKDSAMPLCFRPEELGAMECPPPSLHQLALQCIFEAEWWKMTRSRQRKVALELGLMLIDSLSLKRSLDSIGPDVQPDDNDDDERPNAERSRQETEKRPRLDYIKYS